LAVLKPGKSLRFAVLPPGRDPDSMLRPGSGAFPGAQALQLVLDEAIPLLDFLWARESATRSPTVPQQRWALEQRYRALARNVPERTLGRLFLAAFFRPGESAPRGATGVGPARMAAAIAMREGSAEAELVWAAVMHPGILEVVEEELAALELADSRLQELRDAIVSWYGERGHLDLSGLSDHLSEIG